MNRGYTSKEEFMFYLYVYRGGVRVIKKNWSEKYRAELLRVMWEIFSGRHHR